jgi:16S rRNA pseudouridine516 synthase
MERLDRLLSRLGYATRSTAASLLYDITVNGERPRRIDVKVEHSQVRLEGQPLDPDPLWILLHKPAGVTCSHRDQGPLVFEVFPERYQRRNPQLSSVGRLDKDTTGVLLFTDHGQALHRLTSPKWKAEKVYQVELQEPPQSQHLDSIRQGGLMLEGEEKPLLPAEVKQLDSHRVEMVLLEGRYHQVKRTWESLGNQVLKLHRSRFGPIELDGLAQGEYRFLTSDEVENLMGLSRQTT